MRQTGRALFALPEKTIPSSFHVKRLSRHKLVILTWLWLGDSLPAHIVFFHLAQCGFFHPAPTEVHKNRPKGWQFILSGLLRTVTIILSYIYSIFSVRSALIPTFTCGPCALPGALKYRIKLSHISVKFCYMVDIMEIKRGNR